MSHGNTRCLNTSVACYFLFGNGKNYTRVRTAVRVYSVPINTLLHTTVETPKKGHIETSHLWLWLADWKHSYTQIRHRHLLRSHSATKMRYFSAKGSCMWKYHSRIHVQTKQKLVKELERLGYTRSESGNVNTSLVEMLHLMQCCLILISAVASIWGNSYSSLMDQTHFTRFSTRRFLVW